MLVSGSVAYLENGKSWDDWNVKKNIVRKVPVPMPMILHLGIYDVMSRSFCCFERLYN